MPAPADLVYQTSDATGGANLTLVVVTGKRTFSSAFGTGVSNTFDYFISSKTQNEWEVGVGYIDTSTGALVRNTLYLSSNTQSATYSQTTTTVTITATAHGLTTGAPVYLDFTSGTATDGAYTVTRLDDNTFTITSAISATTSGNVTVYKRTNFSAGTKDITNDVRAAEHVRGAGSVTDNHAVLFNGTSGSLIKSAGFGLGTIASQAANNVAITGGTISGAAISNGSITGASISGGAVSGLTTALGVASGGTGLSTLTANNVILGNGTSAPNFVAPSTSGNILTSDGTTWTSAALNGTTVTRATLQTVSGLATRSIDFTSIPSWVKRITLTYANVTINTVTTAGALTTPATTQSLNFTPLIQIGTSTALATTGYNSTGKNLIGATWTTSGVQTNGFLTKNVSKTAVVAGTTPTLYYQFGEYNLTSPDGLTWVFTGSMNVPASTESGTGHGYVTLSGPLSQLRFTTVGNAATTPVLNIIVASALPPLVNITYQG